MCVCMSMCVYIYIYVHTYAYSKIQNVCLTEVQSLLFVHMVPQSGLLDGTARRKRARERDREREERETDRPGWQCLGLCSC